MTVAIVMTTCSVPLTRLQAHLRRYVKDIHIKVITPDRGGEFTTTFGCTETTFDDAFIRENNIQHRLTTPHTPESGTTPIERLWSTLSRAALNHLLTSGLSQQYYFDAMIYAADVYNCMPTKSNTFGGVKRRTQRLDSTTTFGLLCHLGHLAICTCMATSKTPRTCWSSIIGLDHDGHGYRAIRVTDGAVVPSINAKAQSHAMSGQLATLHDSSNDKATATPTPLLVQQAGNASGHGASRASPRPQATFKAGVR